MASDLSIAQMATLACLWEVTAPKPGNVHRGADFDDMTFADFATSAAAIAPAIDSASTGNRIGAAVLDAVARTRSAVGKNTNLGTVLLLVPLAAADLTNTADAREPHELSSKAVRRVLDSLSPADARDVYHAIRLAAPGGLGNVERGDVRDEPPEDLREAMRWAAPRDLVARQYVTDFATVFSQLVPWLSQSLAHGRGLSETIVHTFLRLMACEPDSLIARKLGSELAAQASLRAAAVLEAGPPESRDYHLALADFDFWLRSDGHRRNPGTSADVVAAGLFAALRLGIIRLPVRW